jgi:hypothetical protein
MRVEKLRDLIHKIPDDTFAPNIIISGVAVRQKWALKIIDIPVQKRLTGEVSIKRLKLLRAVIRSFYQTVDYAFRK